jgi:hypothetical protein
MTLLLAADQVDLYPPSAGTDAHGWAVPGTAPPAWAGLGNLQLGPGPSDPRAAEGGGAGPFGPAAADHGTLYLPTDAPAADGCVAVVRGQAYVLSGTRLVPDPAAPDGGASCQAADVAGTARWPGGVP